MLAIGEGQSSPAVIGGSASSLVMIGGAETSPTLIGWQKYSNGGSDNTGECLREMPGNR